MHTSLWKTVGAVLSGIAALITALVALYSVVNHSTSKEPVSERPPNHEVKPQHPEANLYGSWLYRDNGVGQLNGWSLVLSRNAACQLIAPGLTTLSGSWQFDPSARTLALTFQNPSGTIQCRLTSGQEELESFYGICTGSVLGYGGSYQLQLVRQ